MKILQKRDCAKKARLLIKNYYENEALLDEEIEAMDDYCAPSATGKRRSGGKRSKTGQKKKSPLAVTKKTPPASGLKNTRNQKQQQSADKDLGAADKPSIEWAVRMNCSDCHLPIFSGMQSTNICLCNQDKYFGCIWQEPHRKDPSKMHTFACFRAGNTCEWGRAKSPKDNSTVQMIVQLPGGKMMFDRNKTRVE